MGSEALYWCPKDAAALTEADVEHHERDAPTAYVKFDLTRETLEHIPELKKVAQEEGAIRTSIIVWTASAWTLPANRGVALHPESDYVAIKAPTLEGTEIWIVAGASQASFERAVGFGEKISTPLWTGEAERLRNQSLKHPFLDRNVPISVDSGVRLVPGSGAANVVDFTAEQGAFEVKSDETIFALLQEDEHLAARAESHDRRPYCLRCHNPVIRRMETLQ
jgi:isoleucyl-tRNA synthetase